MMTRLKFILAVFLLAVLLAACNTVDAPDPNLEDTSWQVAEINGEPLPEGIEITAHFTDETVGGQAPCNVYTAEYKQDGAQIDVDDPIMTQLYCEEENVMDTEEAFTRALTSARRVELEGDNLLMLDDSDAVLLLLNRYPGGM